MMEIIGASRRMRHEYRTKPLYRYLGSIEPMSSTIREGALAYEHGPHGEEWEPHNASREIMLDLVRIGFEPNPQYLTSSAIPIPIEEQETTSIADLDYSTLGRDEYDWTYDYPIPRDRSFARFEFLSSDSSRGGANYRRTTSTNVHGLYERQPPLIQRLPNVNTDRLYVHHDLNTGMIFFSRLPANHQHSPTINTPI